MKPKVVTFDAANTLIDVRWSPGGFAVDCANLLGLGFGDHERSLYERMLRTRWSEYEELNKSRDESQGDLFWRRLTQDWLSSLSQPPELAGTLIEMVPGLLYGEESTVFRLFGDVMETLDLLDALGIRMGVISNWDYSLHRVLKAHNIHHRFEHVIASLEEGVEKPDPRLFHLTLEKFGVSPSEALHVGDDPVDDFRGAQDAGMRAYIIDRRHLESRGAILARLTDLVELIDGGVST
jgi:putative hydrolase of the HAD superfamily